MCLANMRISANVISRRTALPWLPASAVLRRTALIRNVGDKEIASRGYRCSLHRQRCPILEMKCRIWYRTTSRLILWWLAKPIANNALIDLFAQINRKDIQCSAQNLGGPLSDPNQLLRYLTPERNETYVFAVVAGEGCFWFPSNWGRGWTYCNNPGR
jgi:hypothetical protein